MANYIDKDSKINRFINRVIRPARNAIEVAKSDLPAPNADFSGNFNIPSPHREDLRNNDLVTKSSFNVDPKKFARVSPRGGLVSASDLVDLFQYYAYCLTSIRRANIRTHMLSRSRHRVAVEHKRGSGSIYVNRLLRRSDNDLNYGVFMDLNKIAALSQYYRVTRSNFNALVDASPSPLPALDTGGTNPSAAINAFIDRLSNVVEGIRNGPPVNVVVCHSSCHADCHYARGRR